MEKIKFETDWSEDDLYKSANQLQFIQIPFKKKKKSEREYNTNVKLWLDVITDVGHQTEPFIAPLNTSEALTSSVQTRH